MKGTRPLDNDEIRLVSACFSGTFEVRNRSLLLLGVSTGGRISELLSLRIGDVWHFVTFALPELPLLDPSRDSQKQVKYGEFCNLPKSEGEFLSLPNL